MNLDFHQNLIVWHASVGTAEAEVSREGLRVVREAIWCSLHPLIPAAFGHAHYDWYTLHTLSLPLDQWRWEADFHLNLHEGRLLKDVAMPWIVESVSFAEAEQRRLKAKRRAEGRGCAYDQQLRITGYAPWLDDAALFDQCAAVLNDPTVDPCRLALAAGYWHYSAPSRASELQAAVQQAAMRVVLAAVPVPAGAVAMALAVLCTTEPDWSRLLSVEQLAEVPLPRRCLITAWLRHTPIAAAIRQQQHRELITLLDAMAGREPTAPVMSDRFYAEGVAGVLTHGPIHNSVARGLIRLLEQLPASLIVQVLPGILRNIRAVPSRTRREITTLLTRHRAVLMPQLREIAATVPGKASQIAVRVLADSPTET